MNKNDKILILGARGMVGSAINRILTKDNYQNILCPTSKELNLLNQSETQSYFEKNKPNHVILAAAKVGGIHANNTYKADFIFQNLEIQNNSFSAAFKNDVDKFLFLGSSCIYPKNCPQPIKEEYLLTGELEPTNEPYAIAKIAGLKMAEAFKNQYGRNFYSVMPTNLYGENDNYHLENSHVIPGLIARMKKAIDNNETEFKIWGSGKPRREFLYVDDMARACIHVLTTKEPLPGSHINVGCGEDISIGELAQMIARLMNYKGKLVQDTSQPDGMMKKLLDVSKIKNLGWKPEVTLEEGLKKSINGYAGT